ncbi:MAG: RuBisCO large subunit C-terminal-like domain-containing protein [Candidatus Hydrogenedentes bacterium]|nr:RuBisCO large subunit C-terminal-like domain-containing protein [Candidatus Hydrogenedentota bacterium]
MLWQDQDAREALLRRVVMERLAAAPPPSIEGYIVATYFFALRTTRLEDAAEEISYLATSGVHHPPPGSLLEQCSAKPAGVEAFDQTGRLGLAHVAIPLKMLQHPDGHVTTCDLLHTIAGAGIFDLYERQDARLVALQIPEHILKTFPGPAYGPAGIRKMTGFAPDQPAFGTILKPTAGITPEEVEFLVEEAAHCKLFLFVKEDEDLYPDLDYSPVRERARRAMAAIERVQDKRDGLGIIFAPHVTGSPSEILDTVHGVLEHGVRGLMFSETFATGTVRMVREATMHLENPPAIYGHNAGIGTRTRAIWREVIDMLARLDGIDFRQTAPLKEGMPFLRPYGDEWRASEATLTAPLAGKNPTMIVRAGGLDQGNIGLNLVDVEARGIEENILFLAGSAINSITDTAGKPSPRMGAEAMIEAIDVHKTGELRDVTADGHVRALAAVADRRKLTALRAALRQRYPGVAP